MPRIIVTTRSLILLAGGTAWKRFRGRGARAMRERQMAGQARALACSIWAPHVLPVREGAISVLIAQRGTTLEPDDLPALERFVAHLTEEAMATGQTAPALELVAVDTLRRVLASTGAEEHVAGLVSGLRPFRLPSGPTHGDLHRDNIVKLAGQFRVIDFDRFRGKGSPLFDRLHFRLSEVEREKGGKWLDKLLSRKDVVDEIARGYVRPDALTLAYAMQRIAHEGEGALLSGRAPRKYGRQAERLLELSRVLASNVHQ